MAQWTFSIEQLQQLDKCLSTDKMERFPADKMIQNGCLKLTQFQIPEADLEILLSVTELMLKNQTQGEFKLYWSNNFPVSLKPSRWLFNNRFLTVSATSPKEAQFICFVVSLLIDECHSVESAVKSAVESVWNFYRDEKDDNEEIEPHITQLMEAYLSTDLPIDLSQLAPVLLTIFQGVTMLDISTDPTPQTVFPEPDGSLTTITQLKERLGDPITLVSLATHLAELSATNLTKSAH